VSIINSFHFLDNLCGAKIGEINTGKKYKKGIPGFTIYPDINS